MRGNKGFTLVELMVVAVIVAILAAVAIPLMSANKKRAMATEAQAGLGTIRTALRGMYAQTGAYNKNLNDATIANGSSVTNLPGISGGDLDGKYFTQNNYTLTTLAQNTYLVTCVGTGTVAGVKITLDQSGAFQSTGM